MYDIIVISPNNNDSSFLKIKEKFPLAKQAKSYEEAVRKAFTSFFWLVWDDVIVEDTFKFDYVVSEWDKEFIHVFKNDDCYDGICLFPKRVKVASREVTHRFFINKKEIDIQASRPKSFDIFNINTYDEYLAALETSTTDMFWAVWPDVLIDPSFKFDYYIHRQDTYNRNINHVFRNAEYYDGVCLFSKKAVVSQKEFTYRFFINKKEIDIQASTPKKYDIVFISYQEPNAEDNWNSFKQLYPNANRVHGVSGIHQAHIEAAKLATTDMFWVVDADATLLDNFTLSYHVPKHDKDIVHVWKSKNPINDLEYGYGGVKLLPRKLTLNMDLSKPDMTTSISNLFKAMPEISNISAFNTDPFSTWRSAFRECVKLSSRIIDRQNSEETIARLETWCTIGADRLYGEYAIKGALAGRAYGEKNASSKEALSKINDFTWLKDQWSLEKFQQ